MLQRIDLEKMNLKFLLSLFGINVKSFSDVVANFGLANSTQVMTLAANALGLVHTGLFLLRTSNTLEEGALRQIGQEHESAINSYREAQRLAREGSIPAAIQILEDALREFTLTSSRSRNFQTLTSQNLFFANLHILKAVLLFTQQQYQNAIESVWRSLRYNDKQPLAFNLLAFIRLYHIRDVSQAREFLQKSLALNPNQVFAEFYLALLNHDNAKLDKAFALLRKTFELKEDKSPEVAEKTPEILNLSATTLPAFIPYLATEWLGNHILRENTRHELVNIATIFNVVIANCQTLALEHCRVMLLEKRILVLDKIADLCGSEFENFDLTWRDLNSLVFPISANQKMFFFNYPANLIDHHVLKLFPQGRDPERLLSPSLWQDFVKYVIAWAKLGRFGQIDHPEIQVIVKIVKELKRGNKGFLEQQLENKCNSENVLKFFIENYLEGKSWEPWFKVLRISNPNGSFTSYSLIQLLCKDQKVNLQIYKLNPEKCLEKASNVYIENYPNLHILDSADNDEYTLLQPLTSPGTVYRLLAKQDSETLASLHPTNIVAQQFLSKRRLSSLPATAESLLIFDPKQAETQLRLFTRVNNGKENRSTYESIRAEFILAIAHSHLQPVDNYDFAASLKKIINSKIQPYADCASVISARMTLRYVDLDLPININTLFAEKEPFSQPIAKNLFELLRAEMHLHGYSNIFSRCREQVEPIVLNFLRKEKIITDAVTPEILVQYHKTIKNSFLKRYCLGYACALLAMVNENKNHRHAYFELAKQCGFYKQGLPNLLQISQEVLGLPICSTLDLQLKRFETTHVSEVSLIHYREILLSVYQRSTLLLPLETYVNYALIQAKFIPKWHLPSHNWIYQSRPDDEAWLHLRDSINANHVSQLRYLLLRVEFYGGKPPYQLSEIKLENVSSDQRNKVANWLVHLLAKSDIKIAQYDIKQTYDEKMFVEVAKSYQFDTASTCRIS